MFGETPRDFFGLIKTTFPFPPPKERNGDENASFEVGGKAWISEGELGELSDIRREVDLAAVFEIVDESACFSFAMKCCEGEVERKANIVAVRAGEGVCDGTIKSFSTSVTERGFYWAERVCAGVTEVRAMGEAHFAGMASGWVE